MVSVVGILFSGLREEISTHRQTQKSSTEQLIFRLWAIIIISDIKLVGMPSGNQQFDNHLTDHKESLESIKPLQNSEVSATDADELVFRKKTEK